MSTPISLRLVIEKDSITADMGQVMSAMNRGMESGLRALIGSLDASFSKLGERIDSFGKQWERTSIATGVMMAQQFDRAISKLDELNNKMATFGGNAKAAASAMSGMGASTPSAAALRRQSVISDADFESLMQRFTATGRSTTTIGGDGLIGRTEQHAAPGVKATVTYDNEDERTRVKFQQSALYSTVDDARGEGLRQRAEMHASRYAALDKAAQDAGKSAADAGRKIESGMSLAGSAVESLHSKWRSFSSDVLRAAGMIYVFERIGRAAESAFIKPLDAMMEAGDSGRKFRMAVAPTVGGMAGAGAVDESIQRSLGELPLTLKEVRDATVAMAHIPALASGLAMATPEQAAAQAGQFGNLIGGLATLNPEQSVEKIVSSVENVLQGNTRGLRQNLHIDPDELAQLIGRSSARDMRGDPQALLSALERYVSQNVSVADVADRGKLYSVQVQKVYDDLSLIGQKLGESAGLYDAVVSKIRAGETNLLAYIEGDQFAARAEVVGRNIGAVLDNVAAGLTRFLSGLSGSSIENSPDGVAEGVQKISGDLADFSKALPTIGWVIGSSLRTIGGLLLDFVNIVMKASDALGHNQSMSGESRAGMVEQRLSEMGFSHDDFRINKSITGYDRIYGPRAKGTGDSNREPIYGYSVEATPGANQQRVQQMIAMASGMSDSALLDPSMFGLMARTGGFSMPGGSDSMNSRLDQMSKLADGPQGYLRRFNGLHEQISRVGQAYDAQRDPIDAVQIPADSALNGLLDGGGIVEKVNAFTQTWRGEIEKMIVELKAYEAAHPDQAKDIAQKIRSLEAMPAVIEKAAQQEMAELPNRLAHAVSNFGLALAEKVKSAGPVFATEKLDQIATGNTPEAIAAGNQFGWSASERAQRMGLASFGTDDQNIITAEQLKERLAAGKLLGGAGTTVGQFEAAGSRASAADMARMGLGGPLPSSDSIASLLAGRSSVASQDVLAYQNALDAAKGTYGKAQSDLNAHPDDPEAQRAFTQAKVAVVQYQAELVKAQQATTTFFSSLETFGTKVQSSMESSLSKGISGVIMQTGKASEILRSFATEIANSFSEMASHNLMSAIMGDGKGNGVGNGLGGLMGAGVGLLSNLFNPGAVDVSGVSPNFGPHGAADGGMFSGGLRFFAGGGIVRGGPGQLAVIGERGNGWDEAVIPMHGGAIPIGMDAGGGFHATLPGGHRIPAAMYSDGGIMGSGRFGNSMALGPNGSGSAGGDTVVHTHLHLDGKEIAVSTYRHSKDAIRRDMVRHAMPGGDVRRALGKA